MKTLIHALILTLSITVLSYVECRYCEPDSVKTVVLVKSDYEKPVPVDTTMHWNVNVVTHMDSKHYHSTCAWVYEAETKAKALRDQPHSTPVK